MPLKHKWPIWALSWTCLVYSKHGARPNNPPKASYKFTDVLTYPPGLGPGDLSGPGFSHLHLRNWRTVSSPSCSWTASCWLALCAAPPEGLCSRSLSVSLLTCKGNSAQPSYVPPQGQPVLFHRCGHGAPGK